MVLGLYYITKIRPGAKGEGMTFYGEEEAIIAYNEGRVDIHILVKVIVDDVDEEGNPIRKMHETTVWTCILLDLDIFQRSWLHQRTSFEEIASRRLSTK